MRDIAWVLALRLPSHHMGRHLKLLVVRVACVFVAHLIATLGCASSGRQVEEATDSVGSAEAGAASPNRELLRLHSGLRGRDVWMFEVDEISGEVCDGRAGVLIPNGVSAASCNGWIILIAVHGEVALWRAVPPGDERVSIDPADLELRSLVFSRRIGAEVLLPRNLAGQQFPEIADLAAVRASSRDPVEGVFEVAARGWWADRVRFFCDSNVDLDSTDRLEVVVGAEFSEGIGIPPLKPVGGVIDDCWALRSSLPLDLQWPAAVKELGDVAAFIWKDPIVYPPLGSVRHEGLDWASRSSRFLRMPSCSGFVAVVAGFSLFFARLDPGLGGKVDVEAKVDSLIDVVLPSGLLGRPMLLVSVDRGGQGVVYPSAEDVAFGIVVPDAGVARLPASSLGHELWAVWDGVGRPRPQLLELVDGELRLRSWVAKLSVTEGELPGWHAVREWRIGSQHEAFSKRSVEEPEFDIEVHE